MLAVGAFCRHRMHPHPKFGSGVKTDNATHTYQENIKRFIIHIMSFSRQSRAGF